MTAPTTHAVRRLNRGGDAMTSQVDTVIAPPSSRRTATHHLSTRAGRVRELGTLALAKVSPAGQAVAR